MSLLPAGSERNKIEALASMVQNPTVGRIRWEFNYSFKHGNANSPKAWHGVASDSIHYMNFVKQRELGLNSPQEGKATLICMPELDENNHQLSLIDLSGDYGSDVASSFKFAKVKGTISGFVRANNADFYPGLDLRVGIFTDAQDIYKEMFIQNELINSLNELPKKVQIWGEPTGQQGADFEIPFSMLVPTSFKGGKVYLCPVLNASQRNSMGSQINLTMDVELVGFENVSLSDRF